MNGARGPDISLHLRWYPIVTFLQLLVDLMTSTVPPMGYGHNYSPERYIDATQPKNWTSGPIIELKNKFAQ
jgi:uncharacterized membrane protein